MDGYMVQIYMKLNLYCSMSDRLLSRCARNDP